MSSVCPVKMLCPKTCNECDPSWNRQRKCSFPQTILLSLGCLRVSLDTPVLWLLQAEIKTQRFEHARSRMSSSQTLNWPSRNHTGSKSNTIWEALSCLYIAWCFLNWMSSSVRALGSQASWVCGNILWLVSGSSSIAPAKLFPDVLLFLGAAYLNLRALRLRMGEVC